ncbi:TPA: hypothetical protein ACWP16_004595, partial [Escherichia coli]
VVITETTKKNKNNKIRGVLPGQNSFLIFIGVYRQHYYEENRIIKSDFICKTDNRQPCSNRLQGCLFNCRRYAIEPRQPGGYKLKTAPVRPVVAARSAEYVCSEDLFY